MKSWPQDFTVLALGASQAPQSWTGREWTRLVQQSRAAGLLGRVAQRLPARMPLSQLPAGVAGHFDAAQRVARAQQAEIRREVGLILRALDGLGAPIVLLKGAAYVMAELPAAGGRVFGDIDIMVPKAVIEQAESRLMMHGWMTTHHSEYDQRYYRQWMHELPPLQHMHRGTVLDVHHAILPETARLKPAPRKLFDQAVALPRHPGLYVLAPHDMVLHSMTHLFMNDDMQHALRDLSDLNLLLRHFGAAEGFWPGLVPRAAELDLLRPLYYGLRQAVHTFQTPVPPAVLAAIATHAPRPLTLALMDSIWRRVLRSPHRGAAAPLSATALFALYLRGHWLRMPPLMLARHLAVKAAGRLHKQTNNTEPKPA